MAVIALAASAGLPLWLSVLSDSGGLLIVLANSLWPLTWRVGGGAEQSTEPPSSSSSSSQRASSAAAAAARSPFQSGSVRGLTGTLLLSTTWTFAQLLGAHVANSSSLRSDALAMLVDDAAYAFNLAAELRPKQERAIKLAAPLVSAAILLVVTARCFSDAIAQLGGGAEEEAKEVVDGRLVLGFGAAMLVVDMLMLRAILFRTQATRLGEATSVGCTAHGCAAPHGCGHDGSKEEGGVRASLSASFRLAIHRCQVSPRSELNLFSCLSHVVADTLRSLTQVHSGDTQPPLRGLDDAPIPS